MQLNDAAVGPGLLADLSAIIADAQVRLVRFVLGLLPSESASQGIRWLGARNTLRRPIAGCGQE